MFCFLDNFVRGGAAGTSPKNIGEEPVVSFSYRHVPEPGASQVGSSTERSRNGSTLWGDPNGTAQSSRKEGAGSPRLTEIRWHFQQSTAAQVCLGGPRPFRFFPRFIRFQGPDPRKLCQTSFSASPQGLLGISVTKLMETVVRSKITRASDMHSTLFLVLLLRGRGPDPAPESTCSLRASMS